MTSSYHFFCFCMYQLFVITHDLWCILDKRALLSRVRLSNNLRPQPADRLSPFRICKIWNKKQRNWKFNLQMMSWWVQYNCSNSKTASLVCTHTTLTWQSIPLDLKQRNKLDLTIYSYVNIYNNTSIWNNTYFLPYICNHRPIFCKVEWYWN